MNQDTNQKQMNTAKKHEIKPGVSVCAWCRCEFDTATGKPIRRLPDYIYALVLSHGCCKVCSDEMMAQFRQDKASQISFIHTQKTLDNTPESVLMGRYESHS